MQRQHTIAAINNHLHILSDEVLPMVLTNIEQLSQDHVTSYGETAGESVRMSFETFDALV